MKKIIIIQAVAILLVFGNFDSAFSCTNILVSRGATTDGSVIITYSCDGEFLPHL